MHAFKDEENNMDVRVRVHMESERPASRLLFVFVILHGAIFQMGLYVCFFHCFQCARRNFSLGFPALRLHPALQTSQSVLDLELFGVFQM